MLSRCLDENSRCLNSDGSFSCPCKTGYRGDGVPVGGCCTLSDRFKKVNRINDSMLITKHFKNYPFILENILSFSVPCLIFAALV